MIRLGRISYVNMAPVFYRLDAEVDEVQGVPTDLNARLVAGEIDLAPISSIEYARNADRLRLLPRLCVSSEGAVDSIQLVARKPLEQVRTVAVTPESATSVVLTKVLLPEAEHVPLGEEADAKLLIGDAALKSAFEDPTPHYDLGRLWLERTGLPMVFAVWACADPGPPGLLELEKALVESLLMARAEPEQLAYESSERYGYPAGFLARYFEKLRYRFGPRERAGLLTFLELAQEVGELDEVPELRFVHERRSHRLTLLRRQGRSPTRGSAGRLSPRPPTSLLRHDPAHHRVPLAFGAEVDEASLLVQGPRCVVEDGHLLAVGGVVWVPLHHPAAGPRDQVDRTAERDRRHALPPVLLVHEDARDPVVRQLVEGLLVLLAVVDVRQFLRRAVLGPRNRLVALENQGSVCSILLDQLLLERVIALCRERLLGVEGVEPGAPTPTEHTVVPLDESGERVPGIHSAGV